jgi:hypothetical protein
MIQKHMEVLKATQAREITKESVTDAETLVVNGVSVSKPSEHPMQAGDFYFRPTVVAKLVEPSLFRRVFLRKTTQIVHDVVTTIVLSCPRATCPSSRTHPAASPSETPSLLTARLPAPHHPSRSSANMNPFATF